MKKLLSMLALGTILSVMMIGCSGQQEGDTAPTTTPSTSTEGTTKPADTPATTSETPGTTSGTPAAGGETAPATTPDAGK